jgi:predicted phosphodiesterase
MERGSMTDSVAFIHLSDIHFGQERNGFVHINNDIKAQLIEDVRQLVETLPNKKASGVLVTGDIAFSGKVKEYKEAGAWLDALTEAAGCDRTAVMMVPGNHDIDLTMIDNGTQLMLDDIRSKGQVSLEGFLRTEHDRDTLYRRFEAYQPFALAYNCPLDREGGRPEAQSYYLTSDQSRVLRFVGLNSALTCTGQDEKGHLLLGRRQWPIPCAAHEEVVVLIHHPLDWLKDSADAKGYILNRARVLITGHEHDPKLEVIDLDHGGQLMMLAAGATARPENEAEVAYTYNVLEFAWLADEGALAVTVHPRAWIPSRMQFGPDDVRLGGRNRVVTLRRPAPPDANQAEALPSPQGDEGSSVLPPAEQEILRPKDDMNSASDIYPQLRYRFFRELSPKQRVAVLVALDALPVDFSSPLTHADETRALDSLRRNDRLEKLKRAIDEQSQITKLTPTEDSVP